MYKLFFVFAITFVFFGCTETKVAEPEKKEPPSVNETVPVKEADPVKENQSELTSENFDKGASIHHIAMPSLRSGEKITFGDYKGKKILFDFWSSWCEPCIAMFPVINKLKTELEDKAGTLKILSISIDPMPGKVKKVMSEKGVLFEVLQAPESLANSGILMPYLAIADETGKIIATSSGKHTYEELVKLIEGK